MSLEILTVVLAGGKGSRLMPLTEYRNKPAVPFAGKYRLVDIPLSNAINSGLNEIYVLTQGPDYSFITHLNNAWSINPKYGSVKIITPQSIGAIFRGDADAVRHMSSYIERHDPEYVLIVPGDNIVKMDYYKFTEHLAQTQNADAAISLVEKPLEKAADLGSMEINAQSIVTDFREKDPNTPLRASDDQHFFASMGTYVFRTERLLEILHESEGILFGAQIIPELLRKGTVLGYNFSKFNEIPGYVTDPNTHEEHLVDVADDSDYWEDVGKLADYFKVQIDDLQGEVKFNVYSPRDTDNPENLRKGWPFYTHMKSRGPGMFVGNCNLEDVLSTEGLYVENSKIYNSIVSPGATIVDSQIMDSIVFEGVQVYNSKIRGAIVDKHSILENIVLSDDQPPEDDEIVTKEGIIVVPRSYGRE